MSAATAAALCLINSRRFIERLSIYDLADVVHFVSLHIDGTEGSGGTKVFAFATADTFFRIDAFVGYCFGRTDFYTWCAFTMLAYNGIKGRIIFYNFYSASTMD
jgi:hypothetical protein